MLISGNKKQANLGIWSKKDGINVLIIIIITAYNKLLFFKYIVKKTKAMQKKAKYV